MYFFWQIYKIQQDKKIEADFLTIVMVWGSFL